jgi:dCTP deaminase
VILPAQLIRHHKLISPFHERTVINGMSFGLSSCGYDVRIAQTVTMRPNDFKLVSTLERFKTPDWLVAQPYDKSTWARLGLAVQNTVIEPGWEGYLTLEITNHGANTLIIEEGSPIAQIMWHLLSEPTEQPYVGKYQNQEAKPVPAKLEV